MSVGDINLGAISAEIKLDLGSIKGDVAQAQTIIQNFAVAVEQNITQKFGSAQKSASASLLALETSIQRISNASLTTGAALVGAFGMAAKDAANFAQTIQQVKANTDMSAQATKMLTDFVRQLGRDTGEPLDKLAKGFMHAQNFLQDAAASAKVLETANKAAVATGAPVEQTTQLLAKVMKEFGINANEAGRAMSTLMRASQLGDTTMEQWVHSSGQAYAMAANLKISFTDASAILSTFAQHGLSAAEGATQLKNIIAKMEQPTAAVRKELEYVSKVSGVDLVRDFSNMGVEAKGPIGVFKDMEQAAQKMGVPVEELALKLFPNMRGSIGALIATGTGMKDLKKNADELNLTMNGSNDVVGKHYKEAMELTARKVKVLQGVIRDLGTELGTALHPIIEKVTDALKWLLEKFQALPGPVKSAFAIMGGTTGAGLLIVGFIGKVALSVMQLKLSYLALRDAALAANLAQAGGGAAAAGGGILARIGAGVAGFGKFAAGTVGVGLGALGLLVASKQSAGEGGDSPLSATGSSSQDQAEYYLMRKRIDEKQLKLFKGKSKQELEKLDEENRGPKFYEADLKTANEKVTAITDALRKGNNRLGAGLLGLPIAQDDAKQSDYLAQQAKQKADAAAKLAAGFMGLPSAQDLDAEGNLRHRDGKGGRSRRGVKLNLKALRVSPGANIAGLTDYAKRDLQKVDDLIAAEGGSGWVTSGKRSGQNRSKHNFGGAFDIVVAGNMPARAAFFRKHGLAANFEPKGMVNPNGSRSSGDHIHISGTPSGKDALAVAKKAAKSAANAKKDAEDEKEDKQDALDDAYDQIAELTLTEYQKKVREAMREWQKNQKKLPVAVSAKLYKARIAAADKERAEQYDQKQAELEEKQKNKAAESQSAELEDITAKQALKKKTDDENDKRYEEFEAKHKKLEADRTAEELAGILEKQERERKFQERKLSFEVESGIISKREYVAILEQKLDAEEVFSDRWIEISLLRNRKLKEIEDDAASDLKKQAQQKEQWMAPFKGLAEGISGIFENSFQHLLTKGFKGFFDGILQGFTKMLQQMIAKWMAAQVLMGIGKLFGGPIGAAIVGAGMSMGGFDDGDNDLKARRWGFDFQDMFDRGRLDAQKGRNIGMAAAGAGGGGHNITIHMGGVQMNNAMDARQTAREIAWQIQDSLRVRPGGGAR